MSQNELPAPPPPDLTPVFGPEPPPPPVDAPLPLPAPAANTDVPHVQKGLDAQKKIPKDKDQPSAEQIEAEIRARMRKAWSGKDGVISLVQGAQKTGKYTTNDRDQIAKTLNVEVTDPKIDREIARREQIAKALDQIDKINTGFQAKTCRQRVGEPGVFEFLGTDGTPTGETIRIHQFTNLLIDEVSLLALDATDQARALNAQDALKGLQANVNLVTYYPKNSTTPEHYFDLTHNQEQRHAQELVDFSWDVLAKILDADVLAALRGANDGLVGKMKFKELKELVDPHQAEGRLGLLLATYENPHSAVEPQGRILMTSFIYQELQNLDLSALGSAHPELATSLNQFNQKNREHFQVQLENLKVVALQFAEYSPEDFQMYGHHLRVSKLFENILTSSVFESFVEQEDGKPILNARGSALLPEYHKRQNNTEFEKTVIDTLIKYKRASKLLEHLGFHQEQLKDPNMIGTMGREVADAINIRRVRAGGEGNRFTADQLENVAKITEHHIFGSIEKIVGENNGMKWIRALGMLALLFGPQIQKLFDTEGMVSSGGQQEG